MTEKSSDDFPVITILIMQKPRCHKNEVAAGSQKQRKTYLQKYPNIKMIKLRI